MTAGHEAVKEHLIIELASELDGVGVRFWPCECSRVGRTGEVHSIAKADEIEHDQIKGSIALAKSFEKYAARDLQKKKKNGPSQNRAPRL